MPDLNITLTIPEAYQERALAAVDGFAGWRGQMEFQQMHGDPMSAMMNFEYDARGAEEPKPVFAQRVFRTLFKALVKAYELHIQGQNGDMSYTQYRAAVAAIPSPSENVPEDIVS